MKLLTINFTKLFLLFSLMAGFTFSANAQWTNDASGINYNNSVGVGTASSTSHKLYVRNNTAAQNAAFFQNSSTSTGVTSALELRNSSTTSGTRYGLYTFVPTIGTGTGYGLYVTASGTSDYAAQFNGRTFLNGYVGIGTALPSEQLEVAGNVKITGGTANGILFADGSVQTTSASNIPDNDWTESGSDVYHDTGQVGIGTTTPAHKLEVSHGSILGPNATSSSWQHYSQLHLHNPTGTSSLYGFDQTTRATFSNNRSSEVWALEATPDASSSHASFALRYVKPDGTGVDSRIFNVQGDGFVGINTTTPTARLEVMDSTTNDYDLFSVRKLKNLSDPRPYRDYLKVDEDGRVTMDMVNLPTHYHVGMKGPVAIGSDDVSSISFPSAGSTYQLAVVGEIMCEGLTVKLSSDWPDYVFEDDYELMPLEEVKAHIAEKGHLPGVASADEVAEKGLNVAEMQQQMMEKIEELTLHLIEQQARIQELEAQLDR